MEKSGAKAYLVNTGWNGTGKRISIKDTRGIIDAILNGDINKAPTKKLPYFDFEIPTELTGVATEHPRPARHLRRSLLSGTSRQRISLPASSRTSSSTKATRPARRSSQQARSSKADFLRSPYQTRKRVSGRFKAFS